MRAKFSPQEKILAEMHSLHRDDRCSGDRIVRLSCMPCFFASEWEDTQGRVEFSLCWPGWAAHCLRTRTYAHHPLAYVRGGHRWQHTSQGCQQERLPKDGLTHCTTERVGKRVRCVACPTHHRPLVPPLFAFSTLATRTVIQKKTGATGNEKKKTRKPPAHALRSQIRNTTNNDRDTHTGLSGTTCTHIRKWQEEVRAQRRIDARVVRGEEAQQHVWERHPT